MSEVNTVETTGKPAPALVADPELSHQDYRTLRETGKAPEVVKETSAASKEAETVPDSETGEEVQEPAEPKKKGGFQKRIDKLTREKAELEARLAGKPAATQDEKKPEPVKAAEGKPLAKDFETYEAFIEQLTDWKADQRDATKTKEAADAKAATEAKAAGAEWGKQLAEARTRYEDYDEVALTDAPISQAVHDAIVGSENGADLAYFLGANPAERERINGLKPLAATLALGKILASLDANAAEDTATPENEKPKVSAAPAPIKPVGTKSASAGKRVDDMSNDEYRKARESGKVH